MTSAAVQRLRGLGRADVILGCLFALHLVVKLALFSRLSDAPLIGDEAAYVDGARALSNLVRDLAQLGPVDTAELQRSVVGSGWFMPGMSILLTPLFMLDPDASVAAIRGYLGVGSSLLLLVSVLTTRRVLGRRYAAALLVFPGLVPMWLLFSFAAWGDLSAGLLIVVLLCRLLALVRQVRAGEPPTLWQGAQVGLLAIAVVYLRSSAVLLVVGLCAVLAIGGVVLLKDRARMRGIAALAAAAGAFVAVLLPWSAFASHTLGGRVVTTTSVPVVMANTFGDPDRLCFGPCDPGSTIWFNPLRYSREVAAATGHSEVEVQAQMSAYARQDVTPHSYASDVLDNIARYALDPAGFEPYLRSPDIADSAVDGLLRGVTNAMFFALLAVALAMLVSVWRGPPDAQLLSIMVKVGLIGLFTQPFVHLCGSRYWTTAAPLFALAAGLGWAVLSSARQPGVQPAGTAVLTRWLTRAQAAIVLAVLLVVIVVIVLAS